MVVWCYVIICLFVLLLSFGVCDRLLFVFCVLCWFGCAACVVVVGFVRVLFAVWLLNCSCLFDCMCCRPCLFCVLFVNACVCLVVVCFVVAVCVAVVVV